MNQLLTKLSINANRHRWRSLKSPDSFPYHRTTVTDTNSSDLEVERKIQPATNAFGSLLPKLKMYNGAVPRSLLNATECSSRSWQVYYYAIYKILGIDGRTDVEVLRRADCYYGSSYHLISPFLSFAGEEILTEWTTQVLQEHYFMVISVGKEISWRQETTF